MTIRILLLLVLFPFLRSSFGGDFVALEKRFLHIRNAEPREWAKFPEEAQGRQLSVSFDLEDPDEFSVLTLRQKGTKQIWDVILNDTKVGNLLRDHNHLESGFAIPVGLLKAEGNRIEISTTSENPDDIRIGDLKLHRKTAKLVGEEEANALSQARGYPRALPEMSTIIRLTATEEESGAPLPCRFTIIDTDTGGLVLVGAESNDRIAVRDGVVYSLDGSASIRLAGDASHPRSYRVFCGRGFEYGIEEADIYVDGSGKTFDLKFSLRREVETPGLVACDPHLHTYEFDRHGDCTLVERLISIAGEGVELPISTAHDKHIEYAAEADRIGASQWFTPILGCEVTTHLGHFNTFPIQPSAAPAQHKLRTWEQIFKNIFDTPGVRVCILNHGRDIHRGFTPLHPDQFDRESGTFKNGRILRANAMELINSGAQQTDPMQLVGDWFSLLKSGHSIAGIGSSDSHTVNFAIAGQARTYLPCPDGDVSSIPVGLAVETFLKGETMVCFGLLSQLEIESGEAKVSVLGPSWTRLSEVRLFLNGKEIRTIDVPLDSGGVPGRKFSQSFSLEEIGASAGGFLCAVAKGPGITASWWPMMPPYQPDSPSYEPFVMGISQAVWVE